MAYPVFLLCFAVSLLCFRCPMSRLVGRSALRQKGTKKGVDCAKLSEA
jgi:hypothetical protein